MRPTLARKKFSRVCNKSMSSRTPHPLLRSYTPDVAERELMKEQEMVSPEMLSELQRLQLREEETRRDVYRETQKVLGEALEASQGEHGLLFSQLLLLMAPLYDPDLKLFHPFNERLRLQLVDGLADIFNADVDLSVEQADLAKIIVLNIFLAMFDLRDSMSDLKLLLDRTLYYMSDDDVRLHLRERRQVQKDMASVERRINDLKQLIEAGPQTDDVDFPDESDESLRPNSVAANCVLIVFVKKQDFFPLRYALPQKLASKQRNNVSVMFHLLQGRHSVDDIQQFENGADQRTLDSGLEWVRSTSADISQTVSSVEALQQQLLQAARTLVQERHDMIESADIADLKRLEQRLLDQVDRLNTITANFEKAWQNFMDMWRRADTSSAAVYAPPAAEDGRDADFERQLERQELSWCDQELRFMSRLLDNAGSDAGRVLQEHFEKPHVVFANEYFRHVVASSHVVMQNLRDNFDNDDAVFLVQVVLRAGLNFIANEDELRRHYDDLDDERRQQIDDVMQVCRHKMDSYLERAKQWLDSDSNDYNTYLLLLFTVDVIMDDVVCLAQLLRTLLSRKELPLVSVDASLERLKYHADALLDKPLPDLDAKLQTLPRREVVDMPAERAGVLGLLAFAAAQRQKLRIMLEDLGMLAAVPVELLQPKLDQKIVAATEHVKLVKSVYQRAAVLALQAFMQAATRNMSPAELGAEEREELERELEEATG